MKDCILIGAINHLKYKDILPKTLNNELQFSHTNRYFLTPDGIKADLCTTVGWITNLPVKDKLPLPKYKPADKAYIDGMEEVLNVDKVENIPPEYNGMIAVPITFLRYDGTEYDLKGYIPQPKVNGKNKYSRLIIQRHDKDKE